MILGEVSFCGKKAQNLKSDNVKQKLLNDLDTAFGLRVMQKHHDNYKQSILSRLQKTPHYISTKTCGNPYYLYFTKYENKNICVFIDKKIQNGYIYPRMIVTKLEFIDQMYEGLDGQGMVLNGEMVCANGDWTFLISDIVLHHVKNQTSKFIDRLNTLYSVLHKYFTPSGSDVCSLEVKRYFTYDKIDELEAFIADLPYTCRGLFFKPVYDCDFLDVMYNFEQTPMQKQKFKYSEDSSNPTFFCSVPSKNEGPNIVCSPPPVHITPPPPPPPLPPPSFNKNNSTGNPNELSGIIHWWTKKTPVVDVYELFDDSDIHATNRSPSFIGIAHISSLVMSRWMRNNFVNLNMFQKIELPFHWNKEFHKWTPIL
jgi:hypothetical protein